MEILSNTTGLVKRTVMRSQAQIDRMIENKVPLILVKGQPKERQIELPLKNELAQEDDFFSIGDIKNEEGASNLINSSTDMRFLESCRNDERKTVRQLAEKRIKELRLKQN